MRTFIKLYLVVYKWPASGKLYLPGLQTDILSARILGGKKKQRVSFEKEGTWTVFQVPYQKPDPLISIIELKMKGSEITVDNTQALDPEIGLRDLSVKFAKASDCRVYKSSWMEKFGEWKHVYCISDLNRGGSVRWTIDVKTPGIYQIALKVRGEGRPVWKVETGEGNRIQNQQSAPSAFLDRPIGWLRFDQPGKQMITVCMPDGGKADLASISITPVHFE